MENGKVFPRCYDVRFDGILWIRRTDKFQTGYSDGIAKTTRWPRSSKPPASNRAKGKIEILKLSVFLTFR